MSEIQLYNRKISRKDIEIMAPAGNFESLQAAIDAGADSVYFGVGHLNMRAHSSVNFTFDDLPEIVKRCTARNVKSYLTINTVLYDHDLAPTKLLINKAKEAGVSALIVSDIAAIQYAQEVGMSLHASTQLNISNVEALRFFAQFVDVAVLARELTLNQVAHIYRAIENENIVGPSGEKLQLEIFAHGALCMAVSGKCYMSLHQYNSSANRGACLQTCRRSYILKDKESGDELEVDNEYIMSPKDLCTIGFVNKIVDSGVSVLKIEGRARSPEYVSTAVRVYSEAIEALEKGTYTEENIEKWTNELAKVFNRGFWNGYYLGQRLGEWSHVYGSQATERKVFVAKCSNYFSKIGVAEFKIETGTIKLGDKVEIIGPTTGMSEFEISEIRVDLKPVDSATKSDICSIPVPKAIRRGDKLYLIEKTQFAKLQ